MKQTKLCNNSCNDLLEFSEKENQAEFGPRPSKVCQSVKRSPGPEFKLMLSLLINIFVVIALTCKNKPYDCLGTP